MVNIIHQINPLLSLKNSAEHRKVLVDDFLTSRHHGLPIIHSFIHSFIYIAGSGTHWKTWAPLSLISAVIHS